MGIAEKSAALKIEPSDFYQKMRIDSGYQTAVSEFGFCDKSQIGENGYQKCVFSKSFHDFSLIFKNRNVCQIALSVSNCKKSD